MKKIVQACVAYLMLVSMLLPAAPVYAQDIIDATGMVTYEEEKSSEVQAAANPEVYPTQRQAENREVDGKVQRGQVWCAQDEGQTRRVRDYVFAPALAGQTVIATYSGLVSTIYSIGGADAEAQTATLAISAWVNMTPSGGATSQAKYDDTKSIQLARGQVVSDTLEANLTKEYRIAFAPGEPLRVTVEADSKTTMDAKANTDLSIRTRVASELCLFYAGLPARMGDWTWLDGNGDGIQQETVEMPLANVPVSWVGPESGSTKSGPDGTWSTPLIASGIYTVTFGTMSGYTSTVSLAGSPLNDSNPTVSTVVLEPGEVDLSIDHGYVGAGELGDRCWLDENNNGIQDSNEPGQSGCVFTVFRCGSGEHVATQTSDSQGMWRVPVGPGSYYVHVAAPNGGYRITWQQAGDDPSVDSNPDPESGDMACVSLTPETSMSDVTLDVGVLQDSDVYVARKEANPVNVKSGDTTVTTLTVGNNTGVAREAYVVDSPEEGQVIVDYPDYCDYSSVVNELMCDLGDLQAGAQVVLTYTSVISTSITGNLRNDVFIHARGVDLDRGNNDYSAYIHVIGELLDQFFKYFLPIVGKPVIPERPAPCDYLLLGQLHVLSKGEEYVYDMMEFYGHDINLPFGRDLDYIGATEFWVTFDNPAVDPAGIQFNWRQYAPEYLYKVQLGLDHWTFPGGFPGELFRLELEMTSWLPDGSMCHGGFSVDENVDPPMLQAIAAWIESVETMWVRLSDLIETINK